VVSEFFVEVAKTTKQDGSITLPTIGFLKWTPGNEGELTLLIKDELLFKPATASSMAMPEPASVIVEEEVKTMTARAFSTITCKASFNNKEVPVPSPWSRDAMRNTVGMPVEVTNIVLRDLESNAETANDFVDFAVEKVPMQGLTNIFFQNWMVSGDDEQAAELG